MATIFSLAALPDTAIVMCGAGLLVALVGGWRATQEAATVTGLEKLLAFTNLCVAIPLAIFGALHLFGPQFVGPLVPPYMPWPGFWVDFVGVALLAASLSIATNVAVRWSGSLFGLMMFLFVALIHFPGSLANPQDRFGWTIVVREMAFGGAGCLLASTASTAWSASHIRALAALGRVLVTLAMLVFGILHFWHPTALPGVPLQRQMPEWLPAQALIGYSTGAALLLGGASVLFGRHARAVLSVLGGWIALLVLCLYTPLLIAALYNPAVGARIEGVNYFADTLLFGGAILAVAKATPRLPSDKGTLRGPSH